MMQGLGAEKFIMRHWWISVILRIRSWNLNIRNTKAESYCEVTLWKTIRGLMQYSLNKGHQHLEWKPQKSWTLYQGFQDVQDKQQMQYPLILRSKWKMHQLFKNRSPNVQIFWIRLPRHKWPKSWSSMADPVGPLERNLYGHPLAGLLWKRHFEKILF